MLVSLSSAEGLRLEAIDVRDGSLDVDLQWLLPTQDSQAPLHIQVRAYASPLTDLGLVPGDVGASPGRPCRLEQPLITYALDFLDPVPTWLKASDELDVRTKDRLFAGQPCRLESRCRQFDAAQFELATHADVFAIEPLDETRVLWADLATKFYESDGLSVTPRPDLDGMPAYSLLAAQDGSFWFGGLGSRIMHGPLGGPYEAWTVSTSTLGVVPALAESPDGRRLAAMVLGPPQEEESHRTVEYFTFEEGAWTRIYEGESGSARPWESDIVWTTDQDAVFTHGGPIVAHYDGRRVHTQNVATASAIEHISGALWPAGTGAVYSGGRIGALMRLDIPFGDIDLVGYPIPNTIQSISGQGDDLVVSGTNGFIGQWSPNTEPCDGRQYHPKDALTVLQHAGRVFIGGSNVDRANLTPFTILTPL